MADFMTYIGKYDRFFFQVSCSSPLYFISSLESNSVMQTCIRVREYCGDAAQESVRKSRDCRLKFYLDHTSAVHFTKNTTQIHHKAILVQKRLA